MQDWWCVFPSVGVSHDKVAAPKNHLRYWAVFMIAMRSITPMKIREEQKIEKLFTPAREFPQFRDCMDLMRIVRRWVDN